MAEPVGLLPHTLDPLMLKAVSLGGVRGHGVLRRIERNSSGALSIQRDALCPASRRLAPATARVLAATPRET